MLNRQISLTITFGSAITGEPHIATDGFKGNLARDVRDAEPGWEPFTGCTIDFVAVAVDVSGEPVVELEREYAALLPRD